MSADKGPASMREQKKSCATYGNAGGIRIEFDSFKTGYMATSAAFMTSETARCDGITLAYRLVSRTRHNMFSAFAD
jgi:hypothetical protein